MLAPGSVLLRDHVAGAEPPEAAGSAACPAPPPSTSNLHLPALRTCSSGGKKGLRTFCSSCSGVGRSLKYVTVRMNRMKSQGCRPPASDSSGSLPVPAPPPPTATTGAKGRLGQLRRGAPKVGGLGLCHEVVALPKPVQACVRPGAWPACPGQQQQMTQNGPATSRRAGALQPPATPAAGTPPAGGCCDV